MAKVASTSIYRSIRDQSAIIPYHIHSLDIAEINRAQRIAQANGIVLDSRQTGGLIYEHRVKPKKPLKIISCIRDPLSRNISAFFEAFAYHTGHQPDEWTGSLDDLKKIYRDKLDHDYPLDWFDKELNRMLGVNIYDHPFDTDLGYASYDFDNIQLLVISTDLDDTLKSQTIARFINAPTFTLKRYNEGSQKSYAALYQQFKEKIIFDESYLDSLYHSKYARHFYSEFQIRLSREAATHKR